MRNWTVIISGLAMASLMGLASCNPEPNQNGNAKGDSTDQLPTTVVVDIPDYWAPAAGADKKFGYINTKGQWMIQPKYSKGMIFSEGFALVTEKEFPESDYYLINTKGEKVMDPEGVAFTGSMVRYGVMSIGYLQQDQKTVLYHYVDTSGKRLPVGVMASAFSYFPDGIVPVKDPASGKFGFQDMKGNWAIKPIYKTAAYQHDFGLAPVETEEGVGYIDLKGKPLTPFKYGGAYPFFEGKSVFMTKEGKFGYLDTLGQEHMAPEGTAQLYPFFSGGLVGIKQGQIWGFADADFKMVIAPMYYELGRAKDWGRFKDGLRAISMGEKSNPMFRYIDTQGNVVLDGKYMYAGDFDKGIAPVAQRMPNSQVPLYGVVNMKGQWVIEPKFLELTKFTNIYATGGRF